LYGTAMVVTMYRVTSAVLPSKVVLPHAYLVVVVVVAGVVVSPEVIAVGRALPAAAIAAVMTVGVITTMTDTHVDTAGTGAVIDDVLRAVHRPSQRASKNT